MTTAVKMLNDAEVAATRKLGAEFGIVQAKVATIFQECEEIVVAALTRAGHEPDKKAKSVTGKRKDAIAKFKGEFVAEFINGCPTFVEAISEKLGKPFAKGVAPADWKKYCGTFPKGKPNGRLATVYNELSTLFTKAGYKTVFGAAKKGEGEDKDAPEQEEVSAEEAGVKVDISSVAALVKFFADRKIPVENIVEALGIHAKAVGQALPADKILPALDPMVVLQYGEAWVTSNPLPNERVTAAA